MLTVVDALAHEVLAINVDEDSKAKQVAEAMARISSIRVALKGIRVNALPGL
jgi:hypothetical protein